MTAKGANRDRCPQLEPFIYPKLLSEKKSFYSAHFVTSCLDWQIVGNTVTEYTKTTEIVKVPKLLASFRN
jgi:hypothetical protein